MRGVPGAQQDYFQQELQRSLPSQKIEQARRQILDALFWELIYWKSPDLYEELTVGERLHEGIFRSIKSELAGKTVLDAGAGSGRATFEYLRYGATRVHAIEPSRLLHLLRKKIVARGLEQRILPAAGRFNKLPLADHSVDTSLSCSAFTALEDQGESLDYWSCDASPGLGDRSSLSGHVLQTINGFSRMAFTMCLCQLRKRCVSTFAHLKVPCIAPGFFMGIILKFYTTYKKYKNHKFPFL
ncbi:class I SAM-dependent methyltransferase [Dictyobacter kobayashii]|nr:class I SAM-dependent methyltransferase [Dictyobacter kobayashii]